MSRIITFIGKAGTGQTTIAIATAKWFSQQGKEVLFVTHNPSPNAEILLKTPLTHIPQVVAPNLQALQLQATTMLDQTWEEVKQLLSLYIPIPDSEEIYSGELILLPGFDSLLYFNAMRQYYQSGDYEVIVYDSRGDLETLRMLGIPGMLDWYFQRFGKMFEGFSLHKIADSIGGPIASAIVSANVDAAKVQQGLEQIRSWIAEGTAVVGDPRKLTSYLVTHNEPGAIAETRWLWGSAQQINLVANGVLAYQYQESEDISDLQQVFAPLSVTPIPALKEDNWNPLLQALPDFNDNHQAPLPLKIDLESRQLFVFLPGFTKKQVKLTQHGNELTVEAGEQRRNIFLPPDLQKLAIQSGKFEEPYLIVTFEEKQEQGKVIQF
ncbi:anion-transporting ATPase [Fischerella thermalis CCMEE 5330]|uniref:Anion-transporting ATPase n=1 Tax=Fischerella thermalis CCMEE 5330 TaxID=2019670 RepID=A0A2N6ML83_9CYAN|nr:ArsA family ATPase [Fischerella thermalis]PMB47488.1 anion-transporting ATPase [Fischerella thermalis CCMEE 5330]